MFGRLKWTENPVAVQLVSLTAVSGMLRIVVPLANYLFIPLLLAVSILPFLSESYFGSRSFLKAFLRFILPTLLLFLFLAAGFIASSEYTLFGIKEVLYAIAVVLLGLALFAVAQTRDTFNSFTRVFSGHLILFSTLVSLAGLGKYLLQLRGVTNSLVAHPGTSLSGDYNFFALFSFFGIIAVLNRVFSGELKESPARGKLYLPALGLLCMNILLSTSRRGLVMMMVLVLILSVIGIFLSGKDRLKAKFVAMCLAVFISVPALMIIFLALPYPLKRSALYSLGITVKSFHLSSTSLVYRYATVFGDPDYLRVKKIIWNERPDPLNPDTGWNTRTGSIVSISEGRNREIVPPGALGYRFDNTTDASTWGGNAYSYTSLAEFYDSGMLTNRNESYAASIYCYVSEEFNGSWVRLLTSSEIKGKAIADYDMERKGEWQKLKIFFRTDSIIPNVNFYFAKDSVTDFSTLRGHILVAYPEYSKVRADSRDPESGWGSRRAKIVIPDSISRNEQLPSGTLGYLLDRTTGAVSWDNTAFSYSDISVLCRDSTSPGGLDYFEATAWCFVSEDFDGDWVHLVAEPKPYSKEYDEYDLQKKGSWQKLNVLFTSETPVPPVYLYFARYESVDFSTMKGFVMFALPDYTRFSKDGSSVSFVTFPGGQGKGKWQLRKSSLAFPLIFLIPRSIQEAQADSTTISEEQKILASLAEDDLAGTRKTRAYYSWILFRNYSALQKIAGNGFDYQAKFGEKFGEVSYDYPHNPFLSAFLYSGIAGGLYYIMYMLFLVYLYLKHIRRHAFYAACFAAVLYFSFFSVNTHFTVTALAFLGLIPFLTRTHKVPETEAES